MNEKINIYEVVKYFVEKSGMLFFYTIDDLENAYNKIYVILNGKNQMLDESVDKEIEKLKLYYNYFVRHFNEYSRDEDNENLFIDIIKLDSSIINYGSNYSLMLYLKDAKNQIVEANSARSFFNKRRAIKDGLNKLNGIVNRINQYKSAYNIEFENSEIDDILDFFHLNALSKEEEIIEAYNSYFKKEYEEVSAGKNNEANLKLVIEKSNRLSYFRSVLSSYYEVDSKLEKRTLVEAYKKPLNIEPEIYNAFKYFKLSSTCSVDEMIDAVEEYIYSIKTTNFTDALRPVSGFIPSSNNFAERTMAEANRYKDILYRYFDVTEKTVENEPVNNKAAAPVVNAKPANVKKVNVVVKKNNDDGYDAYSRMFNGLDYNEARRLYYSMMNSMISSKNPNNSEIMKLESFWKAFESSLEEENKKTIASRSVR